MKKDWSRLTSCLLAFIMVFSLMPTTALAFMVEELPTVHIYHTNTEYVTSASDQTWAQYHADAFKALRMSVQPTAGTELLEQVWDNAQFNGFDESVELWVWSDAMEKAGYSTSGSVVPYFYCAGADGTTEKWQLKQIQIGSGDSMADIKNGSKVEGYNISKAELQEYQSKDEPVPGIILGNRAALIYVWEQVPVDSEPVIPVKPTQFYTVSYSLNQANTPADSQLPNDTKVSGGGTAWITDSGLRTPFLVKENDSFSLFPAKSDADAHNTFTANGYDLLGWKCGSNECGRAGHPLHQVGDAVTATADKTDGNGNLVLTAQWKKWELPSVNDIAKLDLSKDPLKLMLAKVNGSGDMVEITQRTTNGEAVSSELMLDPATSEIYYEATAAMDDSVVGLLHNVNIKDAYFAQFKITVNMAEQLRLADVDEKGNVQFTFTCPFLRPVKDKEVTVGNDEVVSSVTVSSGGSPYTYTVPVASLTNEDGTVKQFSFFVEWKPGAYSESELAAPMTLTTAKATATSKIPFTTTGSVTGWIDPWSIVYNSDNPIRGKNLAGIILKTSSTLNNYLTVEKKLSDEQAKEVTLEYLHNDVGRKAFMDRAIMSVNKPAAYEPCVVTFVNGDQTVATQYIKYENGATQPDDMPTFSGGQDFNGWYYRNAAGELVQFNFTTDKVTDDMELIAQWADHVHQFRSDDWIVVEPTCTTPGERYHTCTVPGCGYVGRETTGPALGHTWGEWERITNPTYTAPGLDRHTCSVCGATEDRDVAQLIYTPDPIIPTPTPVTPTPTPVTPTPGTNIPDEEVPLANTVGLNNIDHFAYIAGYEDGTVRPTNNITRAEVATIFFRLMTEEYRVANWSTSNTFTDAGANAWYNAVISTAAKAGILKGYADGSVKPNANITRAEFAAIAARFISDDVTDDGVGDFSDTANHWAAKEIRLAAKAGWVQGDGGRFRPDDPITRAEVMVLVNRMLDRVPDADHMLPGMKTWSDNPAGTWYYAAVQEATNDHAYDRAEDGVTEIWTELTEAKDWTALEAEWAANGGRSLPQETTQRPSWLMS